MAIVELKWPWLGVAIPSFLIAFIGYSSHFFIFRHYFSVQKQIFLQFLLSMVWLSYYLAIVVPPGSPPPEFKVDPNRLVWSKWCKKCSNYKPERSHHCKTCKTCVLKMDHHCPWTMNCVGYENLPHFLRFLIWVEIGTGFVMYELAKKVIEIYYNRNLPAYLFSLTELTFVIVLTLLDALVIFTITILIARIVSNIFFSGMTQIESWEYERLESQMRSKRLWKQINRNHYKIYGKNLDFNKLISSSNQGFVENDEGGYELRNLRSEPERDIEEVPSQFTIDDIIFPYDISFTDNVYNSIGPLYLFWWPWSRPPHSVTQNGLVFEIEPDFKELDQLGLPWPPDGGDQVPISTTDTDYYDEVQVHNQNRKVRIIDPRLKMKRNEWFNEFGEKLSDFGVDAEADEGDDDFSAVGSSHNQNSSQNTGN